MEVAGEKQQVPHNQQWDDTHGTVQLQLELLRQMVVRAESHQPLIEDLGQIKEQNDILRAIRDRLMTNSRNLMLGTEQSDGGKIQRLQTEGSSVIKRPTVTKQSLSTRTKVSTQGSEEVRVRRRLLNNIDIQNYLLEVQSKCSREAFDIFSQLAKQYGLQKERLVQARKDELECEKLNKEVAIIRNQSMELRVKVKELQTQLRNNEAAMRQAAKTMNQKERQVIKTETSILIKDRLLNEQLKSLYTKVNWAFIQTEALNKRDQSQKAQREYLDKKWDQIVSQLDKKVPDQALNFRKTVLQKGKESLLRQRTVLQEEQQHLDKQHRYIEKIIIQLQGIAPADKPPN